MLILRALSGWLAILLVAACTGASQPAICGSTDSCVAINTSGTRVEAASPIATSAWFAAPVPNPTAISSTFGPRWRAAAHRYEFHRAIDYLDARGTPVLAIGPGVVEAIYRDGSSAFPNGGNALVVRHALPAGSTFSGRPIDRIFAVCLHLASFAVREGDAVSAGQRVGAMGSTGDTEFVHLHFEIRVQTVCSLAYQRENPGARCASGFDPHVHPFLLVGGANDDRISVTEHSSGTGYAVRYEATRGDLDLDVIETDVGAIGFCERIGNRRHCERDARRLRLRLPLTRSAAVHLFEHDDRLRARLCEAAGVPRSLESV